MTDDKSLDDAFPGADCKGRQQNKLRKSRVLIADDETDMRDMLSDLMRYEGYEALPAADGRKALALAAAQPLDLALVDVCMPGPSGMALVNQPKALHPDIKAIVITAYGSLEDGGDAVRSGAFHYLLKPLSVERLRAAIKEALRQHEPDGLRRAQPGKKRIQPGAHIFRYAAGSRAFSLSVGQLGGAKFRGTALYGLCYQKGRPSQRRYHRPDSTRTCSTGGVASS
jgi:two-component system response regulator (stage 0 sporulation protein F)